ncbi:ABC transporter ATP-binding protein [Nocardioides hwasunensis]|uniref:ABC transporter ATP-binding protein n=1 Tax=Nocardioides hwasunensis TaxID=397258 RepID=A0ABR8MJC0_9ACTN|nr:ABC transporter ATP-binding protein [Nocardioides hwasunensis]MBD3914842.1 ABC transporter ATP-binding protein [Nocardioides hwasunensis]
MKVPTEPVLRARALGVGYRDRQVIHALDLRIEPGSVTALVGPNGSGKSTLLHALARVLTPTDGVVELDGTPITSQRSVAVARRLALLPQSALAPPGATVTEVVDQGRYPRTGALGMLRRGPDDAVREALGLTGLEDLARTPVAQLSGGQRQRVWIAMALAQQTDLLLLDEPTTYLDVRHQLDLMELVVRLRDEQGKTIVMVLHDLNQAARHADRIVALRDGRILADGPPAEVLTPRVLHEVFDIDALVLTDPVTSRPMFVAR